MLNKIKQQYSLLPKQVKASAWFLVCSFLQKGISTITTPVFTRLLTPAEYGSYNVFNSWLGIVTILVTMNFYAGVCNQGLIKFDTKRDVFASSLQGLTLVLVACWTGIYLLFRKSLNTLFSLTTVQMLAMLLMIWTSSVFQFWAAEQRVKLGYKKLVVLTVFVSLAKPVVGIIFVLNAEDKVTARILGLALVELIGYSGLFIAQMRRGKKFFDATFWKYAIRFNLPLIPHYLSQTVLNSSDRIMISSMIGESEAGIYSLAYSLSLIMSLFNGALTQTMTPWTYQKIKDQRAKDVAPVTYGSMVMIAFVNLLLIAFAPEVVSVFAPPEYYDAIWIIPSVTMSVFFMFLYEQFIRFEFYFEKRSFIMVASVVAAVLNILLNVIFVRMFGYYAAGYTTLFCYAVCAFAHYFFMRRICVRFMDGERVYDAKILFGITAAFLTLGFAFQVVYHAMLARYVLITMITVAVVLNKKHIIKLIKMIIKR